MYGFASMRTVCLWAFLPASLLIVGIGIWAWKFGDRRVARILLAASFAGILAAVAYDCFRLPFVFAQAWGVDAIGAPQLPLFKVFPRFGALLLQQSLDQGAPSGAPGFAWGAGYSTTTQLLGWTYHFSNGATFGVMFAALFVSQTRRWSWTASMLAGALLAVGIEAALLLSPYTDFFAIAPSATFVTVTLLAHLVFGITLGLTVAWYFRRTPIHSQN